MNRDRFANWLGLGLLLLVSPVLAQENEAWTTPMDPFRVVGNLYYVGSRDLASYLVVTPQGNILINPSLESSVPLIRRSVEKLGFRMADIKILLISHAHFDHDAGAAAIKRMTGARYMVMDGDVPVVESGGETDFAYGGEVGTPASRYPAAKVDRVLHDGDEVRLGGTVLVAHKTPGHTRGCTTWTLRVTDHGRPLDVVIVGSWNVNAGFRLVDRLDSPASYPGIADDYRHSFSVWKKLPCDVFLGAHGAYFDMLAKLEKLRAGAKENVWVDPAGYHDAVDEREAAFEAEYRKQASAAQAADRHGIQAHGDVVYATVDGRDLKLDLYLPSGGRQPPLLVWVHGGAWSTGNKDSVPMEFVEHGIATASLDFRQSTEARFPAQVHDIKAAIRFLRASSQRYGFRADRVAIAGSSSGGHLAALVGVTNGNAELEGREGEYLSQSSSVQAIVVYYGASNLETILAQSTPFGLTVRRPALERLLGALPDQVPEIAALASPVRHVDKSCPPLYLLHGDQDPQMPINQALELQGAYENLGLEVHLDVVHGAAHGGQEFMAPAHLRPVLEFLDRTVGQ